MLSVRPAVTDLVATSVYQLRLPPVVSRRLAQKAIHVDCGLDAAARIAMIAYAAKRKHFLEGGEERTRSSITPEKMLAGATNRRLYTRYPVAWEGSLDMLAGLDGSIASRAELWRRAIWEWLEG